MNANKNNQNAPDLTPEEIAAMQKAENNALYGTAVMAAQTPATVSAPSAYSLDETAVKPAYCTLDTTTAEGKKKLYNATNRPDYNLSEFINKRIRIKDIYVDVNAKLNTDKESDNYGVMENKPRTVIIDENGVTYIAGVSVGIFNAIREIIRIFGNPKTWTEPLEVEVKQVATKRGNMLTLEIV